MTVLFQSENKWGVNGCILSFSTPIINAYGNPHNLSEHSKCHLFPIRLKLICGIHIGLSYCLREIISTRH